MTIKEYWNLIGQETDFSQACSFRRMLMNHKNFYFTHIPDKTNDAIFLNSPKTMFLSHFWPFLVISNGDIFKKIRLSHTTIYGLLTPWKDSEKTNEPIPRKLSDRRKDEQTLFYRTLPAGARVPIKLWYKNEVISKQTI